MTPTTAFRTRAVDTPLSVDDEELLAAYATDVRPLCAKDFAEALQGVKPSVGRQQLHTFEDWTREYGTL